MFSDNDGRKSTIVGETMQDKKINKQVKRSKDHKYQEFIVAGC